MMQTVVLIRENSIRESIFSLAWFISFVVSCSNSMRFLFTLCRKSFICPVR